MIAAPVGILQEWLGQATPGNYVERVVVNASAVGNLMGSVNGMLSTLNSVFTEPASAFITGPHDPKPDTFSMGAWVRTRAGDFNTNSTSVVKSQAQGSQGEGSAAQSVNATTSSSFAGVHGGFDLGLYNISNTNWNANLGFHAGTITGSSASGSTNLNLNVPFYGVYGALTNGVYSFDVLVRRDLYLMDVYSSQGLVAAGNNSDRGNGWSGIVNGQYHYNIAETGWYAEPSLAFLWSNAAINPLAVNAPGSAATAIHWNNIDSATGRAGIRVGTAFQATSDLIVAPYATLSIWHEFAGNSVSSLNLSYVAAADSTTTNVVVSTNRVGTFGQFGLGSAFSSPLPGLSGFVRGDLRFGERLSGEAINAGLRWQF
jgi:outer membrane autotransporter protein